MKKINKKILILALISSFIFSFWNISQADYQNIQIPKNYQSLPKAEKITILKKLILEIKIKINKIILEKQQNNFTEYLTYRDKRGDDFILKYPKKWKTTIYKSYNVFDFKAEPSEKSLARFVVGAFPKKDIDHSGSKDVSIDFLKKKALENKNYFEMVYDDMKIIKNEEIEINGKKGIDFFVSYTEDLVSKKSYKRQVILLDSKNMVLLDIYYTEDDKNKIEPVFEYMIKNFKTTN